MVCTLTQIYFITGVVCFFFGMQEDTKCLIEFEKENNNNHFKSIAKGTQNSRVQLYIYIGGREQSLGEVD